jgi:hypothetical protein
MCLGLSHFFSIITSLAFSLRLNFSGTGRRYLFEFFSITRAVLTRFFCTGKCKAKNTGNMLSETCFIEQIDKNRGGKAD